jgi:hypothetical protein
LEALHPEFGLHSKLEELLLFLHSEVVTRLEIADEVNPTTERSASNVQQDIRRHEALLNEKVELELAHFVPQAADVFAVPELADSAAALRLWVTMGAEPGSELARRLSQLPHQIHPMDASAFVDARSNEP